MFPTGANRDTDDGKLDYEGFISPLVLQRYAEYMHENRRMRDGSLRASDNWQKGIPKDELAKSKIRHDMDFWLEHDGFQSREGIEKALCGSIFNSMAYLHAILMEKQNERTDQNTTQADRAA